MRSVSPGAAIALFAIATLAHAAGTGSPAPDRMRLDTGRAIYQQRCAACHGAQGEGAPHWQQRDANGEMPPPPHDAQGHTWKHSDAMLYRLVSNGWRDPFNKTDRPTMPAFKDTLSPNEIRAVITYLKTLWTPQQRRFQREESRHQPFPPDAQ